MSAVSTALASVAARQAQTQAGLSAIFAKQQRQQDASLIALIQDGAQNLEQVANTPPPGLGKYVDTSA